MEQLNLNWQSASIQQANINRVRAVIAPLILKFCKAKGVGSQFHMEELTKYVSSLSPIAPDSAGRILRDLRQEGLINYKVVNRRASLYELIEKEAA